MKKYLSFLFSSLFLFLLTSPLVSAAGLVQCDETATSTANGSFCGLCTLFSTIKEVYDKVVELTLILAVAYVLWGGYEIMVSGANPALYTSGKKRILNAFLGICIVLAAWFIVNAFIVGLTGGAGGAYGTPWRTLQCL